MARLSDRWRRTVTSLREATLRVRFVEDQLLSVGLEEAAETLDEIAGAAEQADGAAREVLAAVVTSLFDPAWERRVDALRDHAERRGLLALARLLRRAEARHVLPPPPPRDERPIMVTPGGRPLSLGERKSKARGRDRMMLDRLLRDADPNVIANLLTNPRITEDDVVRLCARRPSYARVLTVVARSPRWSVQPRVRLALVENPFTPPSIAIPLLALLVRPELDLVVESTTVAPAVRAAAVELLERRPPIPIAERGIDQ